MLVTSEQLQGRNLSFCQFVVNSNTTVAKRDYVRKQGSFLRNVRNTCNTFNPLMVALCISFRNAGEEGDERLQVRNASVEGQPEPVVVGCDRRPYHVGNSDITSAGFVVIQPPSQLHSSC